MSYEGIAALRLDLPFQQRVDAASFEQANVYQDDEREDISGLADDVLRSGMPAVLFNLVCNEPGLSDQAADTTAITDAQILAPTSETPAP